MEEDALARRTNTAGAVQPEEQEGEEQSCEDRQEGASHSKYPGHLQRHSCVRYASQKTGSRVGLGG